ncbi:MAG: hypothetical protein V3V16_02830 [Melioribacteraceae bacterium]
MSSKMRPRVKVISKLSKDEIQDRIKNYIESSDNSCDGWVRDGLAVVCAGGKDKHLWTPQLSLQFDDIETGTEVRGVIGPGPSVWTGFIFAFALLGFITFVILMWGLINFSLGNDSTVLWFIPVILSLIIGVYVLARFGQKLSKEEVVQLNDFVEENLS